MVSSVILSSLASVASFIPYIAIYLIVREIIGTYPDISSLNAPQVIAYGWLAFGGVVGNILLYFCALMCSHLTAFGTLYQLKVNFASRLAKVPLGFHVMTGSGKLRKIMDENIEKIEEFIAHQLPDIVASFVAPVAILIGMNTGNYASFASDFMFYLLFVPAIASILMKTMYVNSNSMRILSGVESMDAILARPVLRQPQNPRSIDTFDIEFKNATFSYDEDKEIEALSGVSFTAKQGEITAIVGPSGGGKSTIAHLIPRFFDVTGGSISLGGADIRNWIPVISWNR